MIKLIKLERQHLHLKTYVMTSLILGLFILVFTYFVANVAQIEQETEFMVYENIFLFSSIISTLLFGILSATMYNNLIIKEYTGERIALLFSYPVNRKKIFMIKVLIIVSLVSISMLICTLIPIIIFIITESIHPIVSDTITLPLILNTFKIIIFSTFSVNAAEDPSYKIFFSLASSHEHSKNVYKRVLAKTSFSYFFISPVSFSSEYA